MHWRILSLLLALSLASHLMAGGTGMNVLVVANQSSSNSLALANYYAEKRGVPPQNILRINWTGSRALWTYSDFSATLLEPLRAMLLDRQLTNEADFLVLSMDIPYRVRLDTTYNSTTAALFYGFKTNVPAGPGLPDSCSLPEVSSNAFAGSELPFRSISPGLLGPTNLLTTMITASNLALARLIVDQGTAGDASFPTQTVWLAKGTDYDRNARFWLYDDAIFNARLQGNYSIKRTDAADPGGLGTILGFQSGAYSYGVGTTWFVPGAMADNLTSFGGQIFQDNGGHFNILNFMAAGASGSYGTLEEPCLYFEKFPSPQLFFYQSRGFTLAENYYLSLTNPYQGLVLGEPLSAPFARPGTAAWQTASGLVLTGTTNLSVIFNAPDPQHPLQQVDLFIDGQWNQTITNIVPAAGNVLRATLNGRTISYTVPQHSSLSSIAAGWADAFNQLNHQTKVVAVPHGDRIELQITDFGSAGPLPLSVQSLQGSASTLNTLARTAQPNFLESTAAGIRAYQASGTPAPGSTLELTITRTNGLQSVFSVTNNGNFRLFDLALQLQSAINSSSVGTGPDGLRLIDLVDRSGPTNHLVEFNLRANSAGWQAAQIQAAVSGNFSVIPSGTSRLDQQIEDLRPRNNLFISAGYNQLPVTFNFDSTQQPDGFHELIAVASEGTSVQTRTKTAIPLQIRNQTWSAGLQTLYGGSNTITGATLTFKVTASISDIARIELFTTGGSAGSSTGQSSAIFDVPGTLLGAGLHPFYAIITSTNGQRHRTETQWIRLTSERPAFALRITAMPPTLSWPAVAGRSYEILGSTSLTSPFAPRATVVPSNSLGIWTDPVSNVQGFYRLYTIP